VTKTEDEVVVGVFLMAGVVTLVEVLSILIIREKRAHPVFHLCLPYHESAVM
jgi:hypothetical protein